MFQFGDTPPRFLRKLNRGIPTRLRISRKLTRGHPSTLRGPTVILIGKSDGVENREDCEAAGRVEAVAGGASGELVIAGRARID